MAHTGTCGQGCAEVWGASEYVIMMIRACSYLDREGEVGYTVHMKERPVQYGEQNEAGEGTTPEQVASAPMVERAFRLLDLLSVTEEGLTLSDLARSLNMSKGSLHGLLKTLERSGAVEQVVED